MIEKTQLLKLDIFRDIKDETLTNLSEFGEILKLKKGEHVFRDKEKIDKIYIIFSGKVSLYKINESAHKKIIFILDSDKIINEVILDELPASISCEVFENATILSFERKRFIQAMENDFLLTKSVLNSLSMKVRRLYRQMKNTTPIKVDKRVAAKLWKLSKDYGVPSKEGIKINLKISVTYLSDMFGMPRETISRALKILIEKGLIIKEKSFITVLDREKLSEYFKTL